MKNYTVKLLLSLLLLLGANNAQAYCYASQWQNGIPVYSSLGVANNTTMESCQQLACQIFPQIPECSQPPTPACSDNVEFQSLACQPNYSGAINQSRTFYCESQSYSDWVTTSDNCAPNPPTCNYSVQEEQRSCGQNEIGSITYKREQNCPDPYGQPVDSGWFEINRSCQSAPPTCQTSVQQRQLSCQPNQTGSITQMMSTVCSDPYGQPTDTSWVTTSNTCVQDPPTCTSTSRQKTEGCGVNEVGSKLYQADDTCPDPYGNLVSGEWYLVTNSCEPAPATCHESTSTNTGSCGENKIGHITYTETLTCANPYTNAVSSGWVATENTCQPAPATCATSTIQRTLSCLEGYIGSITQTSTSSCPDPYGQPIFGQWVEIQNSCEKSVTNPMNVNSPVSPVSPVNTMDVPAPPVAEAPPPAPAEMQVEAQPPPIAAPKPEVSSSATTSSSPTATKTETKTETKVEAKTESKQETPQKVDVPKGKELVGGFGLVMSLEILNNPITFQQQQLEIALEYTQELPNELRGQQGFLHGLLMEGSSDNFYSIVNGRWNALRSSIEVQPDF